MRLFRVRRRRSSFLLMGRSGVLLVLVEAIHGLDREHVVVRIDADLIARVDGVVRFHGGRIVAVLRRAADVVVEDDIWPAVECVELSW